MDSHLTGQRNETVLCLAVPPTSKKLFWDARVIWISRIDLTSSDHRIWFAWGVSRKEARRLKIELNFSFHRSQPAFLAIGGLE